MSIVALSIVPDQYVMMACDGAATHPDTGAVASYTSKITLMPELDTLIGITGSCNLASLIRWYMPASVVDFDSLVAVFPDLVRYVFLMASMTPEVRLHKSCVVIAGWSKERQKYEGWRVVTYPKTAVIDGQGTKITLDPFVAYPVGDKGTWSSAGPSPELMEQFGIRPPVESDNDVQRLFRMVCCARADSGGDTDEGLPFNAGGFVQLAHLTKNFAQSSILHRWPEDVIGEPIDPSRGEPLPAQVLEALCA